MSIWQRLQVLFGVDSAAMGYNMHFNYFTVKGAIDLGNGYVLLMLGHDYGNGPDVKLPVLGSTSDFPIGSRVEVEAKKA